MSARVVCTPFNGSRFARISAAFLAARVPATGSSRARSGARENGSPVLSGVGGAARSNDVLPVAARRRDESGIMTGPRVQHP